MVFDRLLQHRHDATPPAIYVGSTTIDTCLPGFRERNDVDLGDRRALASIWIGNRTRVAAHYDVPDNVACVVAGRRRFTLFPPGELRNLYVGPLHLTPAGQPISLVDFAAPDLERFRASRTRFEMPPSPSWSRGMRCSSRACGGTTSRRSTPSTCW